MSETLPLVQCDIMLVMQRTLVTMAVPYNANKDGCLFMSTMYIGCIIK